MVGAKSAALFASRMSNERSADELRPRNGVPSRTFTGNLTLSRNYSVQPRMDTNEHEYGEPKTGLWQSGFWSPSGECRRPSSSREMIKSFV